MATAVLDRTEQDRESRRVLNDAVNGKLARHVAKAAFIVYVSKAVSRLDKIAWFVIN
jgi:hypothetical protein